MTIAYIDVAKAPVQVPVIDLLQEPQGAAFDFISGQAWIVDKVNPANSKLKPIGEVLNNAGGSQTKWTRAQDGKLALRPWWACEYDFDGTPRGARIEPQRTNYVLNSADLTAASWLKASSTVVPLGDGEFKIVENNGPPLGNTVYGHELRQNPTTGFPVSTPRLLTLEAKAAGRTRIAVGARSQTVFNYAVIDLIAGTAPIVASNGNILVTNVSAKPIPDGWVRMSMTVDARVGVAGIEMNPNLEGAPGNGNNYTGDGVSGVMVRNIQIEDGSSFSTSLIPTGAAATTRAADRVGISNLLFPYNNDEWTVIFNAASDDTDTGSRQAPVTFSDAANTFQRNKIGLYYDSGSFNRPAARFFQPPAVTGGGSITGAGGMEPPIGQLSKMGFAYRNGDSAWARDNGVLAKSNVVIPDPLPVIERLQMYGGGVGSDFCGNVKSIVFIPRRVSDAELLQKVMAA